MRKAYPITGSIVLSVGVAMLLAFFFGYRMPLFQVANLAQEKSTPSPAPAAEAAVTYDEFGIEADRYQTVDRTIRRHETFAEILTAHNVPYPTVVRLANLARPVFDVRRLRAGQSLRIYQDDSLQTARYLVYERDPIHYVVFDLHDSLHVAEGQRPVTVEERRVSGVINSSLYATLDEQNVDPSLAIALSEVFAWQIDFFRIQKGDRFSVIYEQQLVDGQPVGLGQITAARFQHAGSDYFGFYYEHGEDVGYYDEEGNSLRKAFLKAPLKYRRISSRYTLRRFHPVQKRYKAHLGTDYAADPGTPIYAVGDGVVLEARFARYNGNYVKIRHNGTYTTGYLHMSRIAKGIRSGQRVRQGDVIGYVGSTGLATGPHLCYRFWKHGKQVDPLKEQIPSADPINPAHAAAYHQLKEQLMQRLLRPDELQYAADVAQRARADRAAM